MLEKNVQTPSNTGNRLILSGIVLFFLLSVAGTVCEIILVEQALPAPSVNVTITVTSPVAAAPKPLLPLAAPVLAPAVPSDYDACMDLAVHHDELRPLRCCRPDETCIVLEPTTVVDFPSH